jgi:hypothetical protein
MCAPTFSFTLIALFSETNEVSLVCEHYFQLVNKNNGPGVSPVTTPSFHTFLL